MDVPWTEAQAISFCLSGKRPRAAMSYGSSLMACVRDARNASGRYHVSGQVRPGKGQQAESWLGALAYLIMLDQVGRCFRTTTEPPVGGRRYVAKALRAFSDLREPETSALYALRCCFAHNYGLVNQHTDPALQHHFFLDTIEGGAVVRLPARPWNGRLDRRSGYTRTVVDVRALGDLAEGVLGRLHELHELHARDELSIALDGKVQELLARFAYTRWRS